MRKPKIALVSLIGEENPPLGLAYLATYLKEKAVPVDVVIVDNLFTSPFKEIERLKPDIVGISALTVQYNKAVNLAGKIKENLPARVILGGVHISTHKPSFRPCFDLAVYGEGEDTFKELVELYKETGKFEDRDLAKIKGIMYRDNGSVMITSPRDFIEPIDNIPYPDRSFLDRRYFRKVVNRLIGGKKAATTSILTARGCPYKCVFCSTSVFWSKVRMHSSDYVAREVKHLINDYGIEFIAIWDDLFTINKKRIRGLIEAFKKHEILGKVKFTSLLRADSVDDEMCELLLELGVVAANFGFESGSEKILKYLKRDTISVEKNKEAVLTCKKHGITVWGSLMFGSPGETIEDMKKSLDLIDFMKEAGADGIWHFVTTPFPGTGLWKYGKSKGLFDDDFDFSQSSHYNSGNPVFLEKDIPYEEFKKIFDEAGRKLASFSHDTTFNKIKRAVSNPRMLVKKIINKYLLYSPFAAKIEKKKLR